MAGKARLIRKKRPAYDFSQINTCAQRLCRLILSWFVAAFIVSDCGLRCNPDAQSADHLAAGLVATVCRLIESSEEELPLGTLAASVGRSPGYFHRLFKATTGLHRRNIIAPVVGSIFLTGEVAPDEPSNSLSSACLYSAAACCL